jgi:hypothetical protein
MQLQELPIPQAPQDLARGKGIEAHQLPQAGVVHLGVAVGLKQSAEFFLGEFFCSEALHKGAVSFGKGGGVP